MREKRRALCLAGGGVLGAAYEIGAMTAVEEHLAERNIPRDWDVFVGVSAGALVASFLAQGVPARALYDYFSGSNLASWVLGFRKSRTRRFEEGLRKIFGEMDLSNDFSALRRRLLIPAVDIDTSDQVVFGDDPAEGTAITEAVAASCAIPPVFGPMTIGTRRFVDGAVGSPLQLDVAIAEGANRILAVDPIAPQRRALGCRTLQALLTQCSRIEHASRAALALAYAQLAAPHVQVYLLRPRRRDMYGQDSMDWRAVSRLMKLGYELTATQLAREDPGEVLGSAPRLVDLTAPSRAAI